MRMGLHSPMAIIHLARRIQRWQDWFAERWIANARRILGLAAQFLVEAAVLVAVLPLVDSVIQHGVASVTKGLIFWCLGIVVMLFSLAIIITMAGGAGHD